MCGPKYGELLHRSDLRVRARGAITMRWLSGREAGDGGAGRLERRA
jgi:hypothetical protein